MFGELPDDAESSHQSDERQNVEKERMPEASSKQQLEENDDAFGDFGEFEQDEVKNNSEADEGFGDFGDADQEKQGDDQLNTDPKNKNP